MEIVKKTQIAITNHRTATGTVLMRSLVCLLGTDWLEDAV